MVAVFVNALYCKGNETLGKVIRIFNHSASKSEVGYQVRKGDDHSSYPLIFGEEITMIIYNPISCGTILSNRIFLVAINQ